MKSDAELLRSYGESGAEADFATFVERHLSFVYNTALRRTGGDPHRASEISQQVFIALARRAHALARHSSATGWLHVATRHAAISLARREARQLARETLAYHMNEHERAGREPVAWKELQPVIDRALDALDDRDREALLGRFFEQQGFREIGERLRISESAARMRVDRALEKLRRVLRRHGIESTAAALAGGLAQHSVAAVPVGLASTVSSVAVASAPAWGVATATLLTMSKLQTSVAVAVAVAAILSPPFFQLHANQQLRVDIAAHASASQSTAAEQARLMASIKTEMGGGAGADAARLEELRARVKVLRARAPGVVEADLKPPANRGWDSPEAAFETFQWAFQYGDWQTLAGAMTFNAKTKAAADAFYATLAPAVRAQYATPELFFAHAWYQASLSNLEFMPKRLGVVTAELVDGSEPIQLRVWGRDAAGRERATVVRMERDSNGWGLGASHFDEIVSKLIGSIDPATGHVRPRTP